MKKREREREGGERAGERRMGHVQTIPAAAVAAGRPALPQQQLLLHHPHLLHPLLFNFSLFFFLLLVLNN